MGISSARKYIQDLHKRQNDPFLWPDYLTGLPDKPAIIRKVTEVFPQLGEFSIAYVRIANIQPYLLKYGPNQHADVIQWAAASLTASAEACRNNFVGTLNTHDFIVTCRTKNMDAFFCNAQEIFRRRMKNFYSKEDIKKQTVLHFNRDNGEIVRIGLMKLIAVIASKRVRVRKGEIIQSLATVCDALEGSEHDVILFDNRLISID